MTTELHNMAKIIVEALNSSLSDFWLDRASDELRDILSKTESEFQESDGILVEDFFDHILYAHGLIDYGFTSYEEVREASRLAEKLWEKEHRQ